MKGATAALGLWLALTVTAQAKETCLTPPFATDAGEISLIAEQLAETLAPHPSLAKALAEEGPTLCLDDTLYQEQGYYEPRTNRIVLRAGLAPDFQLAILIHEVRHLEQFGLGICPTISATLSDYMRSRMAMEADASAIGVYVAWTLRETGNPGPWDRLASWPTHEDLVTRFASEIAAGGDEVQATSATFAQWYQKDDRREMYAFAICSNYLDALDREKMPPGKATLPEDFAASLCHMPDGRPYGCTIPP